MGRTRLYPLQSNGFIDEKKIFGFLVSTLKLPTISLDELTFEQFGWLYEYHYEQKKEDYEILAHVISVGYARTQTKKKIKLFDDNNKKAAVNSITKEEREKSLNELNEIFKK